jgi:hypothetical protein
MRQTIRLHRKHKGCSINNYWRDNGLCGEKEWRYKKTDRGVTQRKMNAYRTEKNGGGFATCPTLEEMSTYELLSN